MIPLRHCWKHLLAGFSLAMGLLSALPATAEQSVIVSDLTNSFDAIDFVNPTLGYAQQFTIATGFWRINQAQINIGDNYDMPASPRFRVLGELSPGYGPGWNIYGSFTMNPNDIPTGFNFANVAAAASPSFVLGPGTYWLGIGNPYDNSEFILGFTAANPPGQTGVAGTVGTIGVSQSGDGGWSFGPPSLGGYELLVELNGVQVFPAAPNITSLSAANADDGLHLNGAVNPNGAATSAWFNGGTSASVVGSTSIFAVGSGWEDVALITTVTGLNTNAAYYYRLIATNALGIAIKQNVVLPALHMAPLGDNPATNECHQAFADAGAKVTMSPLAIAAGSYHSLVLKGDGTVINWGDGVYEQLNQPADLSNVVVIAVGGYHSLALKADGSVVSWGHNQYGQTNTPANATNIVGIACGVFHSLALTAMGSVIGWGYNADGEINPPSDLTNAIAVAAGYYHSLALRADGTVAGWGQSYNGQLNFPDGLTNIVALAAGGYHSLALRADGNVIGWGDNDYGELTIPAEATNVIAIATAYYHSLALRADGTVIGWGSDNYGQIDIPEAATNIVAISAGDAISLALRADGTVFGLGLDAYFYAMPIKLDTLNLPVSVSGNLDTNSPGSYTLTYTAVDANGNTNSTTRTVVVVDTSAPTVTLNSDNPLTNECHVDFTDPGATAEDACAGSLSVTVSGSVDTTTPGAYTLTYTADDGNGNTNSTTRTVVVTDTLAPTLDYPTNIVVDFNDELGAPVSFTATASDACSGSVPAICTPPSGSTFPIGTNTVTVSATDDSSNVTQSNFLVTVRGARSVKQAVLAEMTALNLPALGNVTKSLTRSLADGLWVDDLHLKNKGGQAMFDQELSVVLWLSARLTQPSAPLTGDRLRTWLHRLVKSDRLLAVLELASVKKTPANSQQRSQAAKEIQRGDAALTGGNYLGAVQHYRSAWLIAQRLVI